MVWSAGEPLNSGGVGVGAGWCGGLGEGSGEEGGGEGEEGEGGEEEARGQHGGSKDVEKRVERGREGPGRSE